MDQMADRGEYGSICRERSSKEMLLGIYVGIGVGEALANWKTDI
jgi:hypothetical protein